MARLFFILRDSAVVAVIIGAKLIAHYVFRWEPVSLNALFTGIIAANVFLMGFMLSGVLADYKESEKIPGELSACLDNMVQEVRGIGITNSQANIGPCLISLSQMGNDIYDWFYKKVDTSEMYDSLNELTVQFEALQPGTETIRETNFIDSGYLLAEVITVSLCGALVLISMDPFYESLLFSGLIAFMLVFLLTLIRDLDNPFGYYERFSGADVTLKPFEDTIRRVARLAGTDCSGPEPVKAKATPNATA
jgi:hypothetical protein